MIGQVGDVGDVGAVRYYTKRSRTFGIFGGTFQDAGRKRSTWQAMSICSLRIVPPGEAKRCNMIMMLTHVAE